MKLTAAIAELAAQDVAGETLAVNADQHRLGLNGYFTALVAADAAHAERQMWLEIYDRGIGNQVELAVACRQLDSQFTMDQPFAAATVLNQVLDRAQFEIVFFAEFTKLRQMRHVAIGAYDFANDRRFLKAG